MQHLVFHFDVISPYAYLAFDALPQALEGFSVTVSYKPVVFGAMLKHLGQLGPAEIPGKRDWTYRQVLWLAQQRGMTLQLPASHPFQSLPLMRLAVACDDHGLPNRHVVKQLFEHAWATGEDAADPQRLLHLTQRLQPRRDPDSEEVKQQLRQHTEDALNQGLFGVPSMVVNAQVFWGFDALPMLRAYLQGDSWFKGAGWQSVRDWPVGVRRA